LYADRRSLGAYPEGAAVASGLPLLSVRTIAVHAA
jgi:hypothetical protein